MEVASSHPSQWSGTVKNGVVVLDNGSPPPEGARVEVTLHSEAEKCGVGKRLLKHAGTVNDLPSDMADQHDHYIHGTPKR